MFKFELNGNDDLQKKHFIDKKYEKVIELHVVHT